MLVRAFFATAVCLLSTSAQANWMARCVNDGICEAYVCVADPSRARQACQDRCGYRAVVTNLSDSNCTAATTVFEWRASDYDAVLKQQEADKTQHRELVPK
jgi:hypothetical protein